MCIRDSHAPDSFDHISLIPQLAPKFFYMGSNRSGVSKIIVIPYIIQNLLPGQGNSLMFHKISQKLKFLKAQIQRLSIQDVYKRQGYKRVKRTVE